MKLKRMLRWLYQPRLGTVDLGDFARTKPISSDFGFDRGLPVDRYYIEGFLKKHASDIRGRVLEIKEPLYTHRFGGDRVIRSDVLHPEPGNPQATIVADLTNAYSLPTDAFDCIILTQTLPFIYDTQAALKTLYHTLKPGGVLLCTVPGISQISREDMNRWGHYWSFTDLSVQKRLEDVFPNEQIQIETYGNVFAAVAFLHGLAIEEIERAKLDLSDPDYQVLIAARAIKPGGTA